MDMSVMSIIEAKLVILGSQGVGKTCFADRYYGKENFNRNMSPTIGALYNQIIINQNDREIRLQVWDTAGQERFIAMAPMYYRNANAAIVMFDIACELSFSQLELWLKELHKNCDNPPIICVVGNKCDLETDRRVSYECATQFAQSSNAQYFEVSALSNTGINEVFAHIANKLIESSNQRESSYRSITDLTMSNSVVITEQLSQNNCKSFFCCQ